MGDNAANTAVPTLVYKISGHVLKVDQKTHQNEGSSSSAKLNKGALLQTLSVSQSVSCSQQSVDMYSKLTKI